MLFNPHGSEENSTSCEVQTKSRSDAKIGQDYGLSRDKVAKYIRISGLIDPLISRLLRNRQADRYRRCTNSLRRENPQTKKQ